jgi:hypothetical protein
MAAVIREPIHPNTAEPADMYHTAISAPGTARKTESAIYRSASARDITVILTLCSGLRGAGGRWEIAESLPPGHPRRRCLGPVPVQAVPRKWGWAPQPGRGRARCLRAEAVYAVWA